MSKIKTRNLFASISDVKQIHPQFSTCQIDVLYKYQNRNDTYLTDEAVNRALPTLLNIPIVGEYSEELDDFKGHGGKIDVENYKFIHTTKPYGVVPESATYEWKDVRDARGVTKTYLSVKGCILWTGRYEEALSIINSEKGKGQSMEIIINSGEWDNEKDTYRIDDFTFSALCILGDNVNPAFEDSTIRKYTLDKSDFKNEFTALLSEIKTNLTNEEVGESQLLKELLKKYSTSIEVLTEKGLKFSEISEDNLEAEIKRVLEIEDPQVDPQVDPEPEPEPTPVVTEPVVADPEPEPEPQADPQVDPEPEPQVDPEPQPEPEPDLKDQEIEDLQAEVERLKNENATLEGQMADFEALKQFKLDTEQAEKATKAQAIFTKFQLEADDVKDIKIAQFSLEEIEEKCYAILGRKLASNQANFSQKSTPTIKLPFGEDKSTEKQASHPYGDLFDKN